MAEKQAISASIALHGLIQKCIGLSRYQRLTKDDKDTFIASVIVTCRYIGISQEAFMAMWDASKGVLENEDI